MMGSRLKFLAGKLHDKTHTLRGKKSIVTDVENGLYEKKTGDREDC